MAKAIGINEKGFAVMQDAELPWYVALTTPQGERKAAAELRRRGLRVYLPKQSYLRGGKLGAHRSTREKHVYRPLWTGYLLCRFTASVMEQGRPMFAILRDCDGVRDLLKWVGQSGELEPIPFSDKLVMAYMRRQRARDFDGAKLARKAAEAKRNRFKPGAQVYVTEGPFASFLGSIDKIEGRNAHVLVEIFGRQTPVVMDNFTETLEPVAKRREAA